MVVWTRPAKQDLQKIYDYIARDSVKYADGVIDKIIDRTEKLEQFPEIGKVVSELDVSYVREIQSHSYRIIYEIKGTDIFILTVIHSRRILSSEQIKTDDS